LAGVIGRVDGFGPPSSAGFYPQLADVIRGRESYLKLSNLVKRGTFQEVSHFNSEEFFGAALNTTTSTKLQSIRLV
jgi:hypothetical protein